MSVVKNVGKRGGSTVLGLSLVAVVCAASAAGYFMYEYRKPSIEGLVSMMPADAQGFAVVRGLPKLAVDFRLWELRDQLQKNHGEAYERFASGILDFLGVPDGGLTTALSETGFDLKAPMGLSLHYQDPADSGSFVSVGYVPIRDALKADILVRKLLKSHPVSSSQVEGRLFYSLSLDTLDADEVELLKMMEQQVGAAGMPVESLAMMRHLMGSKTVAYTFTEDYLLVGGGFDESLILQRLGSIVEGVGEAVTTRDWYADSRSLRDGEWEVFGAFNAALPDFANDIYAHSLNQLQTVSGMSPSENGVADWRSLAFAMNIESDSVEVNWFLQTRENPSVPLDQFLGAGQDQLAARIPGKALGEMRLALDVPALYSFYRDAFPPEFATKMEALNDAMKVDIEADIINRLGSPLSLVAMSGQNEATHGFGAALWWPLHDADHFSTSLKAMTSDLQEGEIFVDVERQGVVWSQFESQGIKFAWTVTQDHLVAAFGEPLVEELPIGLAVPDGSYLDNINDPQLRAYLSDEGQTAFYIDFSEIYAMVLPKMEEKMDAKDWSEMPADWSAMVADVTAMAAIPGYLLIHSDTTETTSTTRLVFNTSEGHDLPEFLALAVKLSAYP